MQDARHAIAIVVLIVAGIVAGALLRRQPRVVRLADHIALAAVFVLLFLLGLDMGSREDVITDLGSVGLRAGLIALAAMVGSLAATSVVWVLFFRRSRHVD